MTAVTSQACACGGCASCSAASAGHDPDRDFTLRHSQLRGRMLQSIATTQVDQLRPLAQLGTRASDDPAIALIDAHAACLHVVAWNCLRLEDDAAIGRTEDRDALISLARLLGAEPRPALAASTTIAFTLDDFAQSPGVALIPKGTAVATVPLQDELPQTFETDVAIEARAAWNEILPVQQYGPDSIAANAASVVVKGTSVAVRAGDHLLLWLGGDLSLAAVTHVERIAESPTRASTDTNRDRTIIEFLAQRTAAQLGTTKLPEANTIVVLGQRSAAFGATAPDASLMPDGAPVTTVSEGKGKGRRAEWEDFVIGVPEEEGTYDRADLDAIYADAVEGRIVVFTAPGMAHAGTITASEELSRAGFAMAAKITRVTLDGIPLDPDKENEAAREKMEAAEKKRAKLGVRHSSSYREQVRETAIYIETGRGTQFKDVVDRCLPTDPQSFDVTGTVALPSGRRVVLGGEAWAGAPGLPGVPLAEVAEIDRVEATGASTRLHFRRPVNGKFRAATLTINGNCAPASHGESLKGDPEILGSGGSRNALLRFTLARAPMAYVPAQNSKGYAAALEVRVEDRLYREVPTLYGQPADARSFTVREVGGKSEIQFAGKLPSGTYNVTARYRTGGGIAGLVDAGRLSTIMTPVLGVKSASNPLPTEGGSASVTIEELREAAPRSVQTLDRIVSLSDYEAFARDFRGVGKAMASEMRDGMRAVVLLTVADSAMRSPPAGSDVVSGLINALENAAVPGRKVVVQGFDEYLAVLEVALATDADMQRKTVEDAVGEALTKAFGKTSRRFGEALFLSALLTVVQSVNGVRGAKIKTWQRAKAQPFTLETKVGEDGPRLSCPGPSLDHKAGLLSLERAKITFSELVL